MLRTLGKLEDRRDMISNNLKYWSLFIYIIGATSQEPIYVD